MIDDPATAASLAAVFDADAGWRGSVPWSRFRQDRTFVEAGRANGTYTPRFAPRQLRVERVDVLVAPDNAESGVVGHLDAARRTIRVQQLSIGSRGQPFVRAVIRAARRGVRVQVLLSGARYVERENRRTVEWLNELGRREGLPLRARVVEPRSRFEQVHTKGVVIDRERTILGSINWNNHSVRNNREVAVVLHGEATGRYYARVFRADWRGGVWRLPVGVLAGLVPLVLVAGWWGSRFRFGEPPIDGADDVDWYT